MVIQKYFNKHIYILISCWFLIHAFLFFSMGIKYAIDTTRFETEATAWLNGQFEPGYVWWYSGYILLLVISKTIFHTIYASIVFQYVFSLAATLFFYQGLCKYLRNKQVAFFTTLFVICYLPIQQWNTCLLTESIFISLILFFIRALSIEQKTHKWMLLFLISILATLVRPNGGILLITCCGLYAIPSIRQKKTGMIFFAIGIVSALFILNTHTATFYQFLLDSFNKGEIICGYAGWTTDKTNISNDLSSGSITKIIDLIFSNPLKSIELFSGRFAALWMDVRSYYSLLHSICIGFYLLVMYAAAVIGFIEYRKLFPELTWITLLYCGLNSALIMLTYADWDGRFLAPLLPVVFIWSGLGVYFSIQFLKRKNTAL